MQSQKPLPEGGDFENSNNVGKGIKLVLFRRIEAPEGIRILKTGKL